MDLPGVGESTGAATDGSKRELARVVHRDRPHLLARPLHDGEPRAPRFGAPVQEHDRRGRRIACLDDLDGRTVHVHLATAETGGHLLREPLLAQLAPGGVGLRESLEAHAP